MTQDMDVRESLMHMEAKVSAVVRRLDHIESKFDVLIQRDIRLKDALRNLKEAL